MVSAVKSSRWIDSEWAAIALACAVTGLTLLSPSLAFATTSPSTDTPIGDIFCTLTGWSMGNTGKALAVISIIVMGFYKLVGRISGRVFLVTVLGIALIFSAGTILDSLNTGVAAGCSTTASWPGR